MINNSKNKRLKKLINSKISYALPLTCVGLCFISQPANAMFKSGFDFFKNLESSSTGTSNPNIKPLTSSTLTTKGGSSLSSKGSKLPTQASSSLETSPKTTTSITTSTTSTPSTSSSLSAKPRVSPSTSTKPVSSSSVDTHTYTSSMHIKLPASEDKNKPPSSGSQARLLIVELGDQVQAVLQLPSSISQSTVSVPQETDTSKTSTSNLGSYVSPLSTTTTTTTIPRLTTSISPYRPSGTKVSKLVSMFEPSSHTQPSSLETKQATTPDYSSLGARPKTSSTDTKTKSTYKSTLTVNLGSKTSTSSITSTTQSESETSTTPSISTNTEPTTTPNPWVDVNSFLKELKMDLQDIKQNQSKIAEKINSDWEKTKQDIWDTAKQGMFEVALNVKQAMTNTIQSTIKGKSENNK